MDAELDLILTELNGLRERFDGLAQLLIDAAERLKSPGIVPSESLDLELARIRSDFAVVSARVRSLANSSGPATESELAESLDGLGSELRHIQQAYGSQLIGDAQETLRAVVQLRHRDGRLQIELQSIKQDALQTLDQLKGTSTSDLLSLANLIVNRRHPAAALLVLATDHHNLDEERQAPMFDLVAEAYGTRIVLAAVEGRLMGGPANDATKAADMTPDAGPDTSSASPTTGILIETTDAVPDHHRVEKEEPLEPPASPQRDDPHLHRPEPPLTPRLVEVDKRDAIVSVPGTGLEPPPAAAPPVTESPITEPPAFHRDSLRAIEVDTPSQETQHFEPLPDDLTTFAVFCERHYVSVRDKVEPAWWHHEKAEFTARVRDDAMLREMQNGHLNRVWLFNAALEDAAQTPRWSTADIASLAALAAQPLAATAGVEPDRLERLKGYEMSPHCMDLRLPLFLEAMRPANSAALDYDRIDLLIESARFETSDLAEFIRKSLKVHFHGQCALDLLRRRLDHGPQRSCDDIADEFARARLKLREVMVQLWSGAGGKIQRTHCREAWDRFIRRIEPVVKDLYPPPQGKHRWNVAEMDRRIAGINDVHRKVADKGDVKYGDRHRSNNAAAYIVELAGQVNSLLRELQQAELQAVPQLESLLPESESRRLAEPPVSEIDPLERLCCQIFRQSLTAACPVGTACPPLSLGLGDFLTCPDLLSTFESGAIDCSDLPGISPWADVRKIAQPQLAAAYLLECPATVIKGGADVLVQQVKLRRRFDLLELIAPLTRADDHEAAHRQAREFGQEATELLMRLHQRWRHLSDMASPAAPSLGAAYKEASDLFSQHLEKRRSPKLLLEWLSRLCRHGEHQEQITAQRLEQRAQSLTDAERRQSALEYVRKRQYADALWALGEIPHAEERWRRETIWRAEAKDTYSSPLSVLRRHKKLLDYAEKLIESWESGYQGSQQGDRPLRTKFAHMMFSPTQQVGNLPIGSNDSDAFRVPCKSIVDWIAQQNLNPSFVPQLRRFKDLLVITPNERVESAALVERLRSQVAGKQGDLCVVLTPRLTAQVRDELLAEFRVPGFPAAVIDDLDLCRLLNPGGRRNNLVLGLLEIIFEQQERRNFTPFERHDGQHVKLEMFVGRGEQAREIALTSQYSRLFSGRKLGKSALLSYVEQKFDNYKLPSGNTLRVVYISGVSAGEEAEFANRILETLRDRVGLASTEFPPGTPPASQLLQTFERFVRDQADVSLLILFDEADLFVERQIDEYDQRREKCLSFVIRSRIEHERDTHGLPRVRFLFSGYRVTHTSAGAWAGAWGDVLRLEPLQPDEASTFVRGPLERLGIKASDVSGLIAWRCGYQPSIIISFCRQLLELNAPESITADDVAQAFDDSKVQDEIRSVIDSNFQGNHLARIVFLTTVQVFNENHPVEGIRDLPETLLERFRRIHENPDWLQASDDKSALSRLASLIEDFVRRQLLRAESSADGIVTYFPRFPHHLPILAQELSRDPEGRIREEIVAYLRGRQFERGAAQPPNSLYPRSLAERLQRAAATPIDVDLPVRAVVLTSIWQEALRGPLVLPNAIDVDGATADAATLVEKIEQPNTFTQRTSQEVLAAVANSPTRRRYPPVLAGGVDLLRATLLREQDHDELFEVESLGRISRPNLEWWFHRYRALEAEPRGYDRMLEQTSGIPCLVGLLDEVLRDRYANGANLSLDDIEGLLADFNERLPSIVSRLTEGPREIRLMPRELDILKMVVCVSRDHPQREQEEPISPELTTHWEEFYRPACPVEPLSPADHVAMSVVQRLGFVPVKLDVPPGLALERFVTVTAKDALIRITAYLG